MAIHKQLVHRHVDDAINDENTAFSMRCAPSASRPNFWAGLSALSGLASGLRRTGCAEGETVAGPMSVSRDKLPPAGRSMEKGESGSSASLTTVSIGCGAWRTRGLGFYRLGTTGQVVANLGRRPGELPMGRPVSRPTRPGREPGDRRPRSRGDRSRSRVRPSTRRGAGPQGPHSDGSAQVTANTRVGFAIATPSACPARTTSSSPR